MSERALRTFAWRLGQDAGGTAAVEFGLIALPALMLLLGSMEVGRMMWTQSALNFATEEAARYASVTIVAHNAYPSVTACPTSSQITAYAANALSDSAIPASTFTWTSTASCQQVSASYVFTFMIPGVPLSPTLKATACFGSGSGCS
jgi:hypothetical protein